MCKKELFCAVVGLCGACATDESPGREPAVLLPEAIILIESGGNTQAVGDKHLTQRAYGPLQIRQPLADDLNRFYAPEIKKRWGKKKLRAEDFLGSRELSVWAWDRYTGHYATRERLGREPTDEDRARIWNGGPNGWRKPSTKKYWRKVKSRMVKKQTLTWKKGKKQ